MPLAGEALLVASSSFFIYVFLSDHPGCFYTIDSVLIDQLDSRDGMRMICATFCTASRTLRLNSYSSICPSQSVTTSL